MVKRIAVVVLTLIAGAVGALWLAFPSYTHRYRMTLTVEADGIEQSGSSVIEVSWQKQPRFGDAPPWSSRIKGQAAAAEINGGVVLAALGGFNAVSADFLALRAFGHFPNMPASFPPDEEGLSLLSQFRGDATLRPDNLPMLVWFRDAKDLRTGRPVEPEAFSSEIGPTVAFKSVRIEMTDNPVTTQLGTHLPWLRARYELESKPGLYSWPGAYLLSAHIFTRNVEP